MTDYKKNPSTIRSRMVDVFIRLINQGVCNGTCSDKNVITSVKFTDGEISFSFSFHGRCEKLRDKGMGLTIESSWAPEFVRKFTSKQDIDAIIGEFYDTLYVPSHLGRLHDPEARIFNDVNLIDWVNTAV